MGLFLVTTRPNLFREATNKGGSVYKVVYKGGENELRYSFNNTKILKRTKFPVYLAT